MQNALHNLHTSSLRQISTSDASYGNVEDLSSQLGQIIIRTDDTGSGNILFCASHKSKRMDR